MWRGWAVWTGKANRIIVVELEVIKVWVDGGRVGLDVSRLVLLSKLISKVNVGGREGGTWVHWVWVGIKRWKEQSTLTGVLCVGRLRWLLLLLGYMSKFRKERERD